MGPLKSGKGPRRLVWKVLQFCCLGFLTETAQGTNCYFRKVQLKFSRAACIHNRLGNELET